MRVANVAGRAVLVTGDGVGLDVERASDGRFGADPQALFTDWGGFAGWAAGATGEPDVRFAPEQLGPPVPRPPQVFAIGVNYREHADEAGYPPDSAPITFTKFPTCLTGADAVVELPTETVDWEVELVLAIGTRARRLSREQAWEHVAGVTVGQDLSERVSQSAGAKPQYSLAKSHEGFGPTGPWLVTADELPDRDDLAISCRLDGETMQSGRTSRMIYDVPELLVRLSAVCTLLPGDLVFSGTPSGVGNARTPKRFLTPGEELVSEIEGVGSIRTRFRAAP
ncbi:fumarylacetoacetate hydrolase family protein [Amnibacterium sp. CER49]|uniref:fumarylacetoacetate hydrolase family protein n=1 Tax=Amnibacterium sp. CER49 TaxID=3039161 RepID=UPI002448A17C|nr:fumarylacetoacetate hydrolase family protein [Amnibacterium sp. CER49]MDH2443172.1 fumarylacetoacetate hydrolase family protein [Amnibacterium sp. CER49]